MKNINLLFLGLTPALCLAVSCASMPKDAPEELKQADAEITRAKELKTEKYMPNTMMNAETNLEDSIKAFKESKNSPDKTAELERSIKLANHAKSQASGATTLSQNMQMWDGNIEDLNGNYSITKLMSDIKELQATADQLKREKEEALASKAPIVESPFAKMTDFRFDIPAVYFSTNSAEVGEDFSKPLEELAKTIKPINEFKVTLFGYADNRGSPEYNEKLSMERAENVASLLKYHGVNPEHIFIESMGSKYAAETDLASKMQLERKVIVTVTVNKPK